MLENIDFTIESIPEIGIHHGFDFRNNPDWYSHIFDDLMQHLLYQRPRYIDRKLPRCSGKTTFFIKLCSSLIFLRAKEYVNFEKIFLLLPNEGMVRYVHSMMDEHDYSNISNYGVQLNTFSSITVKDFRHFDLDKYNTNNIGNKPSIVLFDEIKDNLVPNIITTYNLLNNDNNIGVSLRTSY